jgi:N-acetylglucosaminyldiphosphoundecaprenol N-acetyl-beta-D-mannosaminyltransferase
MAKKPSKTSKKAPQTARYVAPVLGVKIDSSHDNRLLIQACTMMPLGTKLRKGKGYFVTTPNSEIITRATSDRKLRACLESSNMAVPDAIGVIAALKYLSLEKPQNRALRLPVSLFQGLAVGVGIIFARSWVESESEVVPGRIMLEDLIAFSAKHNNPRIFLLGGKSGSATLAAKVLSQRYGITEIKSDAGPWLNMDGETDTEADKELEKEVIEKINQYEPQLLFVAFGCPKQEKWIKRNLPQLKVGIVMTVGGAFDYIAGIVPETPRFVQKAGFEWMWRLITQPARVGRIFTAVVIFPIKVFIYSLQK